jgi:creatinine amidohydrolase
MVQQPRSAAVELAELTWQEAERWLTPEALVMIPLGAAAKEHGPHLRLDNDYRLAEALKARVMARTSVVVAPTISYHHYPAFTEYPGSISLGPDTARDLLIDIVQGIAAHGPRCFYVLNTGVSTLEPLQAAAESLRKSGIVLAYTDFEAVTAEVEREIAEQRRGGHADEIETAMMLYLAPERVAMDRAVRDDAPRRGPGGFHREPGNTGIHSPTGIWGDPTLADAGKGRRLVEAAVDGIVRDLERLRRLTL